MARARDPESEARRQLGYDDEAEREVRRLLGYDEDGADDANLPFAEEIDEPLGEPIDDTTDETETGVPTDEYGRSLIPELERRDPTHNELFLISGKVLSMASTNVKEIWWNWRGPRLFVRFLNGSLYVYHGVSLATAIGMVETMSPGRYVWNNLRDLYPYDRLERGTIRGRPRPQVVRLINR